MAILDVKRLELAKSQLTTEQIFKIKREKFKIKNEIIEIKNTEKPEKESELKLNTREDIDQLIGQLVNAKKLTPEESFIIVRLNSEKFQSENHFWLFILVIIFVIFPRKLTLKI